MYTPLNPTFDIAKLGYAGVYLFFLFLFQNIDCGYSLEPPRRGGSYEYSQSMFLFSTEIFNFSCEKWLHIHGHVFVTNSLKLMAFANR